MSDTSDKSAIVSSIRKLHASTEVLLAYMLELARDEDMSDEYQEVLIDRIDEVAIEINEFHGDALSVMSVVANSYEVDKANLQTSKLPAKSLHEIVLNMAESISDELPPTLEYTAAIMNVTCGITKEFIRALKLERCETPTVSESGSKSTESSVSPTKSEVSADEKIQSIHRVARWFVERLLDQFNPQLQRGNPIEFKIILKYRGLQSVLTIGDRLGLDHLKDCGHLFGAPRYYSEAARFFLSVKKDVWKIFETKLAAKKLKVFQCDEDPISGITWHSIVRDLSIQLSVLDFPLEESELQTLKLELNREYLIWERKRKKEIAKTGEPSRNPPLEDASEQSSEINDSSEESSRSKGRPRLLDSVRRPTKNTIGDIEQFLNWIEKATKKKSYATVDDLNLYHQANPYRKLGSRRPRGGSKDSTKSLTNRCIKILGFITYGHSIQGRDTQHVTSLLRKGGFGDVVSRWEKMRDSRNTVTQIVDWLDSKEYRR